MEEVNRALTAANVAWRYSAFIAGLLSQLHVPVGSMTVTSLDGKQWPRYGTSVYDWIQKENLSRYHVVWHEKAKVTGAEGASLLSTVVPGEVMDWLAATDSQIIRDVNIAVTREMAPSESILGAILKSVVSRVKEVDALHQPSRFGRLTVGTQFEPHLLNAMRELIEEGSWRCNEPGGTVFWGSDGLYVAWPAGLKGVVGVFEKRALTAMPHSSVTLAEMLGLSGIIIGKETGVWVHDIVVKDKQGENATLSAMRFKDPTILLGHLPYKALTQPYGKLMVEAQLEQLALVGASHAATSSAPPSKPVGAGAAVNAGGSSAQEPGVLKEGSQKVEAPASASTPETPAAAGGQPVAAIAVIPHVEEMLPGDRLPKEVLARLHLKSTDSAACALGMALEQSQQYRTDRVRRLEWGVAICCAWLTEVAGYTIPDLASPLDRAGVIAKNPDGRSMALVSKVTFSDSSEPRLAIVLKLDFAARVGMPMDAKV